MNIDLFKEHVKEFKAAKSNLINARSPSQKERDALQAYGMALRGFLTDNIDYVIESLELRNT